MTTLLLMAAFFPGVLMTLVWIVVGLLALGWTIALVVWICSNVARFLVCGTVLALGIAAFMS